MPGSIDSHLSSLAGTRMDGPTDTDIAPPTEAERARIQQCMVDHLPRENKVRVLALLPEVLRFKVDLRAAISLFRGEEFVRTRASSGENFLFVMIQSTDNLHRMQMLPVLERIAVHLQFRLGLDINHADLRLRRIFGPQKAIPKYFFAYFLHIFFWHIFCIISGQPKFEADNFDFFEMNMG